MFGIGETELVLILAFAFIVFGPDKLPGMGRTLGRALRQFKNAQEGFTQVVQTEVIDPATAAMGKDSPRPNRVRTEDDDSDLELADGEAPRRSETFAERRARLAAEREVAAAAAAAAEADESAAIEAAAQESAATSADSQAEKTPAAEEATPVEEAAPRPRTAADLYNLAPRPRATADSSGKEAGDEKNEAGV